MNRRRRVLSVALIGMMLAACGSKTADTNSADTNAVATTTTVESGQSTTTTTEAQTTTTVDGLTIDDISPACMAVLSELMRGYEPAVKDIDWTTATIDDHITVMYALASFSIDSTSGCDDSQMDASTEEGSALFLAVAQEVAPATVGYFTAILEINQALDGRQATGDCLTDIGIFEEQVAGGVKWVDLPLPEQFLTLNLMSSIGYCGLRTQGDLISKPEVQAFLEGSPFG